MKVSNHLLTTALLVSLGSASPLEAGHAKRAADNCLRAVRGTPSIGLAFCSSALTIVPVTSTSYVAAPTVTVVVSTTATVSTTLTATTGTDTLTTTVAAAELDKRRTDPTVNILNQCGNNLSRVSSACHDFLSGVATSTTTIRSTTTPTLLRTVSATTTQTSTVQLAATTTTTVVEGPATPTNLFQNPGFEEPLDTSELFLSQCGDGCGASRVSTTSHSGSYSLQIQASSTYQKAGIVQALATKSFPTKYLFSFWYRVDSPVVSGARLNYWINYEQVDYFSGDELSTEWQQAGPFEIYGSFSGSATTSIVIFGSSDTGLQTFYVDDVVFIEDV